MALSDTDVGKISIVRNGDSFAQTNVAHSPGRPLGVHNLTVSVVGWLVTVCHRHSIDCLLAIDLALVSAVVTANSLLSGSKASTVATRGLVPVYQQTITIGVSGFVPRCS